MDAQISLTGTGPLKDKLARAAALAPAKLAAALYEEANLIMAASVAQVPVDFGILRASHIVLPPVIAGGRVEVQFGYGGAASAYALAVHENPRSGRTGGVSPSGAKYQHWAKTGAWKFLEGPALEMFPTSAERVARSLSNVFEL